MKTTKYTFYIILLLGLCLRLYFAFSSHYISPDGTQYASLGYHLFHDFHYSSNGGQFPDIIQPPLYPFLLGIFTFILHPEYAGKVVSLIFGLALIWGMFRFTLKLTANQKLALSSALFVAVDPALVAVSSQVATEALYLFLLFCLYALVLLYLLKAPLFKQIIAAGIVTGLVYLTRPEGILYFGLIVLVLFLWRKPWRHVLTYMFIVFSFMAVYAFAVHSVLGYQSISPKLNFVRAQGKVSRYFLQQDRQLKRKVSTKVHEQRFRYALAPDKKELLANEIFNRKKAALNHVNTGHSKVKNPSLLLQRFAKHLLTNFILAAKKFLTGWAFPWGFWLFLLFGLWRFPLKKWSEAVLFSAIFILPVGAVLFSNVEQRFFFIVPVLLAPLLGRGFLQIGRGLKKYIGIQKSPALSWIILLLFVILSVYPGYGDIWQKTSAKGYYYDLGRRLNREIPSGQKVAASVPQAVFFAGRLYCPLPFAPLDSLELYLRHKQAAFILLEEKDRQLRPGCIDIKHLPPFLELTKTWTINNKQFMLLHVKKENAHERTNANH